MEDPQIRKIDPRIKGTISAFGFSEDEIEVYFALLELGPSTAEDISKRAKVDLSKTNEILDTLLTKNGGIVERKNDQYTPTPFEDVFVDRKPNPLSQRE